MTGRVIKVVLKDVLYVPSLSSRSNGRYLRLMSVRLAAKAGFRTTFGRDEDTIDNVLGSSIALVRAQ